MKHLLSNHRRGHWSVPAALLLALLSTLNCALSALPLGTAFTYQGRLSDATNAAKGNYDFRFALYDVSDGGSPITGMLTNALAGVSNGYFTVTLDFGGAFDGNARWMQIWVRTNGSGMFMKLMPRQPLTPGPYALHAANAGLLEGQGSSAFAPATNSGVYVAKIGDTMTGPLSLPANGLAVGNSQLVVTNGSVGIGTNAPAAKLDVAGIIAGTGLKIGSGQTLNSSYSSIAGGDSNAIGLNSARSTIGGGRMNTVGDNADTSTIAGGAGNSIGYGCFGNVIGGGSDNSIANTGYRSVVGGGSANRITGAYATIAGGRDNLASGTYSTDGGGYRNTAGGDYSAVGGGFANTATNNYTTVSGGFGNSALGLGATVAGGTNNVASADFAIVSGGEANTVSAEHGTVAGGWVNSVVAGYSAIGGGDANLASGFTSTIGGGWDNGARGNYSVIGGGGHNVAGDSFGTVGGGERNFISESSADHSTIGGGQDNTIHTGAYQSTIGGGAANAVQTNASYAVIPGGSWNSVGGSHAFAAGYRARAYHAGAFVWADSTETDFSSTGTNQFLIRAAGGVGIGVNNPASALQVAGTVTAGGFNLNSTSCGLSSYSSFASVPVNGPVVFANDGGVLGSIIGGTERIAVYWNGWGSVGVGRVPTANKLEVEGNASKTAAGSWLANSDARIKRDIKPITGAVDKLAQVRLLEFRYTDEYRRQHPSVEDRPYVNVVAQEFQEVFPDSVKSSGEKLADGSEILQVDTYPLTIYAAAAVQELAQTVEKTRAENAELKQRLAQLEKRVLKLTTKDN